jgi:glycosyltransferase involved in cell wall biosynthesis
MFERLIAKVINKFLDYIFNLYVRITLNIFVLFIKRSNLNLNKTGIMALPYYSENYPGGHTRIANWKEYFELDGIKFEVFWASEADDFLNSFYSSNPLRRYFFFFSVFNNRLRIVKKMSDYKTIWIQRSFIPFYPFKDAYVEKKIKKVNPNIVFDFYDADYESNYNLIIETSRLALKITVASSYLENYFQKINPKTELIPFAMNFGDYRQKVYKNNSKIIIGWMGSPDNFRNVIQIQDSLIEIQKKNPNVQFVFICRQEFNLNLKKVKFKKWSDENFNYYNEISSFDIGLAPMIDKSERNLAKIAFKTMEYMSSGVAFVSSKWGIPEKLEHNKNSLLASNLNEWTLHLQELINDFDLRKKLGNEAYITISQEYSYSNVYLRLKKSIYGEKI